MGKQRTRTLDDSTFASDPGGIEVSHERLKSFCPHLYGWSGLSPARRRYRRYLIEHMLYGDSRAAVVVSVEPLLVAAYTDELDCVALLRFPSNAASQRVEIGSRLLTVNTYGRGDRYSADLIPGPARIDRWVRFHPIIADFICADPDQVERRKREIAEDEWARTRRLGHEYLAARPGVSRDGSPCQSATVASGAP